MKARRSSGARRSRAAATSHTCGSGLRGGKTGQNDFLTPRRENGSERFLDSGRENGSERFLDSGPTLFPRRVLSQRVGGNKQF
jgi:hypothetical protein